MTPQRRKITLSDIMILVGAIAVALALARVCILQVMPTSSMAFAARLTAVFVGLAVTIILIPLRFRGPRSHPQSGRPGTVACCAVVTALTFLVTESGLSSFAAQKPAIFEPHYHTINLVFFLLRLDFYSVAVAASWLALVLCGHWHTERDWIDRTGRALGACWILSPFIVTWLP